MTDEDAAWCAAAWYSGMTQKDIACVMGLSGPPNVSMAIIAFVDAFYPFPPREIRYPSDKRHWMDVAGKIKITGAQRKELVPAAMATFVRLRDEIIAGLER